MQQAHGIVMKSVDNVCTVVGTVDAVTPVQFELAGQNGTVTVTEPISFGHKFALRTIKKGEPVVKYGEVIGLATKDIEPGQHVHVHNLESCRGRGDK